MVKIEFFSRHKKKRINVKESANATLNLPGIGWKGRTIELEMADGSRKSIPITSYVSKFNIMVVDGICYVFSYTDHEAYNDYYCSELISDEIDVGLEKRIPIGWDDYIKENYTIPERGVLVFISNREQKINVYDVRSGKLTTTKNIMDFAKECDPTMKDYYLRLIKFENGYMVFEGSARWGSSKREITIEYTLTDQFEPKCTGVTFGPKESPHSARCTCGYYRE